MFLKKLMPITSFCAAERETLGDNREKSLVSQAPFDTCEVCVIVPVRNEAAAIEATLKALTHQVDLTGKPLAKNRYEVIVLANNCTDNSAQIALDFARSHESVIHVVEMTVEKNRAHVGWVRKLLMDEACRRLKSIGRESGIIASTDGDTRVADTWIAATMAEIKKGADGVGGRIVTCSQERNKLNKQTQLYYLRYLRYGYLTACLESLLDPDAEPLPRHHHHYGASMAITAQMYAKVGGLPPLPASEDVAFYHALMLVDARFRHSPSVRVTTSARVLGRASAGLSERLAQLNRIATDRQSVMVESAHVIQKRFCLRSRLRYLWQSRHLDRNCKELLLLSKQLDLSQEHLEEIIMRSPTFGLLVKQIVQYQKGNDKIERDCHKATIQKAIADLEFLTKRPSCSQPSLDSLPQIQPISLLAQPF